MGVESLTASERAPYHLLVEGGGGMERDADLEVVQWTGREEISAPYSYRVTVAVPDPDRVVEDLLQQRVTLEAQYDKDTVYFPGVVDLVRRTGRHDERLLYELEVVPRLRATTEHQYQTRIFQNQTVQQIVTQILQDDHDFALDQDFRFDLQEQYDEIDFKVQYHESDLDFIHRLCEREGIFYFFEHGRDREVLCFFDHASKYVDRTETSYRLRPSMGTVPEEEEVLDDLTSASASVPSRIVIVDYNYRRENLPLDTEELVDAPRTRGVHYEYGLHVKTRNEGQRLGRILAEGFVARSRLLHGESTIRSLRSGHKYDFQLFELEDDPLDGRYVMTSVQHEGDQSEAVFGEQESEGGASYRNRFQAIPADRVFRPERMTPHPRVSGFLTGVVESAGGDYPDIDEEGRYVVRLHYDLSGRERAKATKRLRMLQPHGGAREGHHFPLHDGTEVAILCMDGDPDRPVIAGVLPNPSTRSPVTCDNNSDNMILTRSGNRIQVADRKQEEAIWLDTPNESTHFRVGAACGDGYPDGAYVTTRGEVNLTPKGNFHAVSDEGQALLQAQDGPAKVWGKSKVDVVSSDGHIMASASDHVVAKVGGEDHSVKVEGGKVTVTSSSCHVEVTDDSVTVQGTGGSVVVDSSGVSVSGTQIKLN